MHILNVVDGSIPSSMATGTSEDIEEERRLLYVAMTRAKEELHLIVPQRAFVRRKSVYDDHYAHGSRSRFIPNQLLRLFECCAWPLDTQASWVANAAQRPFAASVDLGERVRELWR